MFGYGKFRKVAFPCSPLSSSPKRNDLGSPTTEFRSYPSAAKFSLQNKLDFKSPTVRRQSSLLSQKQHENIGLKRCIKNLEEVLANSDADLNDSKKECEKLKESMGSIKKKNVSLIAELTELKLSNNSFCDPVTSSLEFETKIHSLQSQLKKAKAAEDVAETKRYDAECQLLDQEKKLSYTKNLLKDGLSKIKSLQNELEIMTNNYEKASNKAKALLDLQNYNIELKQILSDKQTRVLNLENAVEEKIGELQEARLLADTENTGLRRPNETLISHLDETARTKKIVEAELQILRQNFELKCKDLEEIKQRLAVSIEDTQLQTKKEYQTKYQERFNNMKQKMLEYLQREVKSREDTVSIEKAKVTELSDKVDSLLREHAQIRSGNLVLIQDNCRIKEDGKKTKQLYTDLQTKYDNLTKCNIGEGSNMTDRITELQRRNTLQPLHMRSVYPAEYQLMEPLNNDLSEHNIRVHDHK